MISKPKDFAHGLFKNKKYGSADNIHIISMFISVIPPRQINLVTVYQVESLVLTLIRIKFDVVFD